MNPDDLSELVKKWQMAERDYANDQWEKKAWKDQMWEEIDKQITLPKTPQIKPILPPIPKVAAKPVPKRPFPPKIHAFDNYTELEAHTFWKPLYDPDNETTTVLKAGVEVYPLYVVEWKSEIKSIYTVSVGFAETTQQQFITFLRHCYSGEPDSPSNILVKFPTPIHDGKYLTVGFLVSKDILKLP